MLLLCCCHVASCLCNALVMLLSCHVIVIFAMLILCPCHVIMILLSCSCNACVMILTCGCHVFAMRLPCDCHDIVMQLPCYCHDIAMLVSCYCHVIAMLLPSLHKMYAQGEAMRHSAGTAGKACLCGKQGGHDTRRGGGASFVPAPQQGQHAAQHLTCGAPAQYHVIMSRRAALQ
jgi:hypothetical protein